MGNLKRTTIDKKIAAKMFDNAKLSRMRNREIEKKMKKQKLLEPKRSSLPLIESDFARSKDSKCSRCNQNKETFGLTYEWFLEPIDILFENKSFYGLSRYSCTKRMLSKITNGIIVEPAKIKIMRYLQENKPGIPMIYVLKSSDYKLDEILLNFILETYNLPTAVPITDGISIEEHLNANKNLILFMDDENQLESVLDCIGYGKKKEIYLMPVSISHEFQKSTKFNVPFLSVFPKMFYDNYGRVKVNFNEPYTTSELLHWVHDEHKYEAIEGHLHHDIVFKRPVFATNIVAYLLLTYFRTIGGSIEEIAARIDELRGNSDHSIDFSFDGDSIDIAKYAVRKLNNKIIINENLIIRPIEKSVILNELWDYAETLICHFALQSVLVLSAEHYKRIDDYVDYNKLIQLSIDFCEILQFEIPIYKACSNIKEQLTNAFDILSRKDLLSKAVVTYTENEKRAQRIAQYFDDTDESDDDEDYYGNSSNEILNPENKVTINVEMQKEIDFLKDVTLPIQESYMNVAYCLKRFIGQQVIEGNYFNDLSMSAMIDECLAGNCKYWESCSDKWLKNSLKLFQMWGVIEKIPFSDAHYLIVEEYDYEEGIHRVARHIEQFSDY